MGNTIMEIVIKGIKQKQVMIEGKWYFIKSLLTDSIRIAQRLDIFDADRVIFLNEGNLTWISYNIVRKEFEILGEVNKIEVS